MFLRVALGACLCLDSSAFVLDSLETRIHVFRTKTNHDWCLYDKCDLNQTNTLAEVLECLNMPLLEGCVYEVGFSLRSSHHSKWMGIVPVHFLSLMGQDSFSPFRPNPPAISNGFLRVGRVLPSLWQCVAHVSLREKPDYEAPPAVTYNLDVLEDDIFTWVPLSLSQANFFTYPWITVSPSEGCFLDGGIELALQGVNATMTIINLPVEIGA